jgi:hypothetical protein
VGQRNTSSFEVYRLINWRYLSMEITPIYKRVIGLDVHQAQITACALLSKPTVACWLNSANSAAFTATAKRWPRGLRL